jgi:1-acyl-sn-glycerol-3-phosphate acyltransferase
MAQLGVMLCGVRIVEHRTAPLPERQTVYISNHTDSLDLFVITALGLPRARYFLSGFLRKILPLGLIGYLIGVFWTVPYRFPDKRKAIFQRADRILRQTGESVYLTPEGSRIRTGQIGHFNRGAFHLATSLGADIVPIYVSIPNTVGGGMTLLFGRGIVDVYYLPTISTADWTVEDLDANRDRVRDIYVDFHERLNQPVNSQLANSQSQIQEL